jgi:multiple sugar transport system permease protein
MVRKWTPWLMIAPSFLFLFVLTAYPLYFALKNSFYYWNLQTSPVPLQFVGLENFRNVFSYTPFFVSLRNTLIITLVGLTIEFSLGLMIALALSSRLKYLNFARALLIMPITIAPIIVGFMFRYMYWDIVGLIPWLAESLNIPEPEAGFLGTPATVLPALLLPDIWQWTPFFALIMYAAIIGVSSDLIEAAKIDGAGGIRLVWSVLLPTIKPVVVVVVLLQLMRLFNTFDLVYVLTNGGPGDYSRTLSYSLFREGLINFNIGVAAAMTILILIIVNIIVFIYAKIFMRGMKL